MQHKYRCLIWASVFVLPSINLTLPILEAYECKLTFISFKLSPRSYWWKMFFYKFHPTACRKFIFEKLTTYIHSNRKIDLFSIWNRFFSCNKRCVVIHNQFSKYFLEHKIFFLAMQDYQSSWIFEVTKKFLFPTAYDTKL